MHSEITIVSFLISILAIEIDKFTQFTHPSLHVIATIGVLSLIFSMTLAA